MKDKKFIINSIKMDLFRVVVAAGDLTKELPTESIKEFLEHADKDFDKTRLNNREKLLREKLRELTKSVDSLSNPHIRLRWAEDVLTTRCRL